MKVMTIESKQEWQSPDGQKTIWSVCLQSQDGKQYPLKTFSETIAQVGWEGEVESYVNQRGDRFVKQTVQEQAGAGPAGDGMSRRIRAQWAITNAITAATKTLDDPDYFSEVEHAAETFYDMALTLQERGAV